MRSPTPARHLVTLVLLLALALTPARAHAHVGSGPGGGDAIVLIFAIPLLIAGTVVLGDDVVHLSTREPTIVA